MRNYPRPQTITMRHDKRYGAISASSYTRGCRCIHCFRWKVIEYYEEEQAQKAAAERARPAVRKIDRNK